MGNVWSKDQIEFLEEKIPGHVQWPRDFFLIFASHSLMILGHDSTICYYRCHSLELDFRGIHRRD